MFRTRDFYLKRVYNIEGKKIGTIEDLYIDFYMGKILGFKIANNTFFSKKNYISMEDIVDIGEEVITKGIKKDDGLSFDEIRDMDIIDTAGNLKGVLEDLIIDSQDYSIKGILISSGLIDKLINGKEIILLSKCILGEKYILYTGNGGILFKSMPHNIESHNGTKKA